MRRSPFRTILYCGLLSAALVPLGHVESVWAQISRTAKVDKGPRALGLLQLPANGKGRLIPICIMIEGKFYDASAYKAQPVPMALWSETEYDVEKTGISQGLFTVTQALQNTQTSAWMAEGHFQTAAELAAQAKKQPAAAPSKPRGLDEDSGPPVLRHSGAKQPAPPEPSGSQTTTAQNVPTATSPPNPPPASAPQNPTNQSTGVASTQTSSEPEDPNRPTLKRGKQPSRPEQPEPSSPASKAPAKSAVPAKASAESASKVQLIPAISDASGPEPRNYAFEMKTTEEQDFQKKMEGLAEGAVRAYEKKVSANSIDTPQPPQRRSKTASKPAALKFSNPELRVFDLTNSNDAVLVFMGSSDGSQPLQSGQGSVLRRYFVTLVAREDLNGNLHQVFSSVTDNQHLDVEPRWDLVDAVDANGDGAGELLFRKVSDSGSAFAVYRVIGDQLYPLFEGTPGQ